MERTNLLDAGNFNKDSGVALCIDTVGVVNFALQQNKGRFVQKISVENRTEGALSDLTLEYFGVPEFCFGGCAHITLVDAGCVLELKDLQPLLNPAFMAALTERTEGIVRFVLKKHETVLAQKDVPITVLAYDEWHGCSYYPELLAAFVTPNHPQITQIMARASEILGNWTEDPSLDGYQTQDVNRVLAQAGAVYEAIREQQIAYAVPPASFESIGQRVRLCDSVIGSKLGTCLDLSLLYASCLEAIGLHPVLLLKKDYAFAGVWLEDLSFPEAVQDDTSLISKRLGIHEIAVVECTLLTAGKNTDFDQACASAERTLIGEDSLEYIVDVHRARRSGMVPLPLRVRDGSGWKIQTVQQRSEESPAAPSEIEAVAAEVDGSSTAYPKQIQWERKLLDLGLRNQLINMRFSKTLLPILTTSLDELENALSDGSEFSVCPKPAEWELSAAQFGFESMHDTVGCADIIRSEFKNRRLRSALGDSELNNTVKGLYRTAKTSMEENGANTLYLALGVLRWYETDRSTKARYAPIVLLPVEIVRKSAAQGYRIRLRDDEPQMNITMLEKIKQDFRIVVNGLDPLPQDEHGIDIRKVFTVLRKAVMEQSRWDVLESAYLGIFSFSQFVMWNDIRNRCDELEKNKIVRSLMDGKLAWEGRDMQIGRRVREDQVLLPLSADASQLFAIEAASQGESFVLHGPPGTGKSQTITALIANALAQGKSVLFVAEKMAALEVVQKRLDRIGLGPFCLELHSNKSKKRDVLEQLRQATEVTKNTTAEEFAVKAEQIAALRKDLDAYADALHTPGRCGMTLFAQIREYETYRDAPELESFSLDFVSGLNMEDLLRQKSTLERLVAAAGGVGHPSGHPLHAVKVTEYSQTLRTGAVSAAENYRQTLADLEAAANRLSDMLGLTPPVTGEELKKLHGIAQELAVWLTLPRGWAKQENVRTYLDGVTRMAAHYRNADEQKRRLLQTWSEEFLSQDGAALLSAWRENETKWFLPKALGLKKLAKKTAPFAKTFPDKKELGTHFECLMQYRKELSEGEKLLSDFREDLGDLFCGENTDWQKILDCSEAALESIRRMEELSVDPSIRMQWGGVNAAQPAICALLDIWETQQRAAEAFKKLLKSDDAVGESWISAQTDLCSGVLAHVDELKEWTVWNAMAAEAEKIGLGLLTDAYRSGLPHDLVLPAYHKALYKAMVLAALEANPTLNSFSGIVFNEKIAQFKKLDEEITKLNQQEIYCRLAAKVPNFAKEAAQSSELGILQRAIRSGGRGVSIRNLFEQLPNLLPRLCPCMLMSPISAAQYLDPKREPFGIVVFDEASQLPTCKAVGALARGIDAVVVGDPKQMPPTSFFATNAVDEDNLDTEDLESILDDCLAMNIPQTHLLWHYRSRHESLIAFSNRQFYENKLYTFPSVNDRESKVRLVPVDGVFERGKNRQNRAEAEAVVAELKRRCADAQLAGLSVGVVTFNISQQNLIDDLLSEACKNDPKLESWVYGGEEPVFIKNLENVQGDERDVILFSVGYGPDQNGKVYMNFGPLNRDGGWRRLNVAVTRARQEMVVFSTLTADQINLSRTSAEGVAALKAFLEYAGGSRQTAFQNPDQTELQTGGIAQRICAYLAENGYETDCNVGHSAYRIDIGVLDPENPDVYLLGILLDGKVYGEAKTTRDREFAQIGVLNGLGWNIHRVWSMDWWDNSRKELARILEILEQLRAKRDLKEELEVPAPEPEPVRMAAKAAMPVRQENGTVYAATKLKPLTVSSEDLLLPRYAASVQSRIRQVLEKEAPVSESVLTKRVIQSYGITRAGTRIQQRFAEICEKMNLRVTEQNGQRFFWNEGQDPAAYDGFRASGEAENKREAKDVPVQEAINAIHQVLKDQISLNHEDLIRETAKLLGYSRIGTMVSELVISAVDTACAEGMITRDAKDKWILKEEME